jgi:two-component system sensor histidine kinase KdpD
LRKAGKRLWHAAKRAFVGGLFVAAITVVCHRLNANFAVASLLYLLVVVAQSLAGDFLPALCVSLGAVGCLDYFFTDPLYTFTVARAVDVVSLFSFAATAMVITELVLRARAEAQSARRDRERWERLYQLSQGLLPMKPQALRQMKFLDLFLGVFGSTAICLFDADTAEVHTVGTPRGALQERTRDAYVSGRDADDPESAVSVRRLQVAGRARGAIGFESLEDPKLTSGPLAILAAALIERTRALRDASEAAAAAQAEVYRSAILDALAHEFKTPLATILAAAGGLPEAGSLNAEQLEMAEIVEAEASRLGNLTSRLLRMARLDREDVRPRLEAFDLTAILAQLVEQQARRSTDHRLHFVRGPIPLEVRADPELLRLAISQLLENACKYSQPGSTVNILTEEGAGGVAIRVSNNGSSIALADQQRIFERFYRGVDAGRVAPGSGLGLFVARKIAAAHGGTLELEGQEQGDNPVTFRFTIPVRKVEGECVATTSTKTNSATN